MRQAFLRLHDGPTIFDELAAPEDAEFFRTSLGLESTMSLPPILKLGEVSGVQG